MPDLSQIVLKAQQMQAEMERAQASLAHAEVTGSAGGGLVRAVVNGAGELQSIVLDPSVVDPEDLETLSDLIVAAVRDGSRAAAELSSARMGSVAGGLTEALDLSGLGLPDFGSLGFGSPSGAGAGAAEPGGADYELEAADDLDDEDLLDDDDPADDAASDLDVIDATLVDADQGEDPAPDAEDAGDVATGRSGPDTGTAPDADGVPPRGA